MAAGAISNVRSTNLGGCRLATGTVEVDNTLRTFELLPTIHNILTIVLNDATGSGRCEARLNQNAGGITVNGCVAIVGNHTSTETYNFLCCYN